MQSRILGGMMRAESLAVPRKTPFSLPVSGAPDVGDSRFVCLGAPRRIWAVSAIHADCWRLCQLHDALYARFRPGDRLVYTGNYTGFGPKPIETIDEILGFRRSILSISGVLASDIVYLRGMQEEMGQKLLQLQFAPNPPEVLRWMLENGMDGTLSAYGFSGRDGIGFARVGVVALTHWTIRIHKAIREHPGHEIFATVLRRAAYTSESAPHPLLFVHAGIDPSKPLVAQNDSFWWGARDFDRMERPYQNYDKIIRGYDPLRGGVRVDTMRATLDGGCGFGGPLVCAGFDQSGQIFDLIRA